MIPESPLLPHFTEEVSKKTGWSIAALRKDWYFRRFTL